MDKLDNILLKATREHWAVGHFNFSTTEQLQAIVEAAQELASPVMVGTSEGERDFLGPLVAFALVGAYQKQGIPVFLNADHTKNVEKAKEAIDAGYESIHIDLSEKSFEENVAGTKIVINYALKSGRQVSVEGELGVIRGSSQVRAETIEVKPEDYTTAEEARRYVKETGINRLAIMIGNVHGIYKGEPGLDIERVKEVRAVLPESVSLVLHAGSGIAPAVIQSAIAAGIANIHISTEVRQIWRETLQEALNDQPDEYAPYRLLTPAAEAVKKLIAEKLKIFGSVNRIE